MPAGDCVFCRIIAGTAPAQIVLDEPEVVAFLDQRPVFKGHTLVVPRAHIVTLPEVPRELLTTLFVAVQRCAAAVTDPAGIAADGSFVAENNVVSQAVPHLHVHVVPRRRKDGLRGFFWPRQKYESDEEMAAYAALIRAALTAGSV
jgi:histidine triad (HIT) family protein